MFTSSAVLLLVTFASLVGAFSISSNGKTPITLITFDVDGTLVQGSSKAATRSVHQRSFNYACGKVMGNDAFFKEHGHPTSCIPPEKYHGATDGLIALNICKFGMGVKAVDSLPKLPHIFEEMFNYVNQHTDEEIAVGIDALPGVKRVLTRLAQEEHIICGLVTGNVEGIARKKMRATGLLNTKVFAPASVEQKEKVWPGCEDISFLGGFGTDFCSGDIEDVTRLWKDRAHQIAIAVRRAMDQIDHDTQYLAKVIHVGDAHNDVLAAKWVYDQKLASRSSGLPQIKVGIIGVATGKYTVEELTKCAGDAVPGKYDVVILEDGLNDPSFLSHCGID